MNGSVESRELVALREGEYARAAHEARAQGRRTEPPEMPPDWYLDTTRRVGKCLCCGERREIQPMMHVCAECFEEFR